MSMHLFSYFIQLKHCHADSHIMYTDVSLISLLRLFTFPYLLLRGLWLSLHSFPSQLGGVQIYYWLQHMTCDRLMDKHIYMCDQ